MKSRNPQLARFAASAAAANARAPGPGTASREELERTLERFRMASGAAGLGFWDYHLASDSLHWDDWMYRLYGVSRQQGQQPYSLWSSSLHPDDRVRCEKELRAAIAGLQTFDTTFRVVHPDGTIHYLKATATVVRDGEGNAVHMHGVNVDVTEVTEARQRLEAMVSMHSALLSTLHSHALVSDTDSTGNIIEANDAFCALSGYSREELIGNNHRIINSGTHPKGFWKAMWRTIASGASWRGEVCNRARDGTLYWVDSMVTRYRDERTQAISYISIRFDITNSKAMAQRLLRDARYDKLTGLANRAQFMARLEKALQRVQSGEQPHYAVLFLDFDRFKLVNDTLGHDAGDELLRQIATRLRGHLRARDSIGDESTGNVVSRFGGDEFLLLVNDLKSPADATRMAERLLRALATPYDIHGNEVYSTASIGIATSEHPAQGAEGEVAKADMAMYEAKRQRRGCSVAFDEQMHTRLVRQVQLESALRHALGTQELRVEYQPIVELATGKVVSAEALVRWTHPSLGEVSPAEFVPVAEDSGLVIPLDAWVLQTACADLARWEARDPEHAPGTISVNLSRAGLALGDRLLEQVQSALSRAGLPADRLQLEITEREVMRDPAAALKLVKDLRAMGVRLAMDDFGTGTSSLGLLRDFPFDTIKIDRSFLHGLGDSPELMAVIHATVTLVENLNMASLAEGVEDPAQVAILLSLGCRYAQGFLFGRSVRAGEFLQACPTGYSVRPVLPPTAAA